MSGIELREFVLEDGRGGCIRAVAESDAEELLGFLKQQMRDDRYFVLTSEDMEQQDLTVEKEKEWIKKHQEEGSVAIVAEIGDNIAGLVSIVNRSQKRLQHVGVLGISILEPYRNVGLGNLLMEAVLKWAEANAVIEKVALAVFDTNSRAMTLYHKFGFVEEGRKVKEVKMGSGEYVDSILMYKFVDEI